MRKFFFNELIPWSGSAENIQKFKIVIICYSKLKEHYSEDIIGIVTSVPPSILTLNQKTLIQIFSDFKIKKLVELALSLFTSFPLEKELFGADEDQESYINDAKLKIGDEIHDAMMLRIMVEKNAVLFSVPTHQDLEKNQLQLESATFGNVSIDNFFGDETNYAYIEETLLQQKIATTQGYDKLKLIVRNLVAGAKFEQDFNKLTPTLQNDILEIIEQAVLKKFKVDSSLIAPVHTTRSKMKLYELKKHSNPAYRTYFHISNNKVYFGALKKKPKSNQQSADIDNAAIEIERLIKLGQ